MEYAIETESLCRDFGSFRAVDGLALKVERGCFYGFLGPNGAGKSTTIKMLTGILSPTSGSIRVLGGALGRNPLQLKRRIGVVPEELCLFESLTAREYLGFVGRMYGLPASVSERRGEELLELLSIAEERKTLAIEYSHGMKKKLSLAAALIHDPELLFLDEPFEGIDAVTSQVIRSVLARMVDRGATIFLTSHILEIVQRLCTHVGIIQQGKLVREGALDTVVGDTSLEAVFLSLAGDKASGPKGLSWLGGAIPSSIQHGAAE
jgi:ABC-2 type transport system ATP-binding protein